MVQGQVFLKWGEECWHFFYLVFLMFIIFTLEITLPFAKLCYAFEEKLFFSATIIFRKKVIPSFLKMNLKTTHKLNNLFVKGFKRLKIDF